MKNHIVWCWQRALPVVLAVCSVLCSPAALAEDVTVSPSAYGYATDGGADYGWTIDGTFDVLTTGGDVRATKYRSLDFTKAYERRGAYEFALPAVLSAPGVSLDSAILYLPVSSGNGYFDTLYAYGYAGDGVLQLGDFSNTGNQAASAPVANNDYELDVTAFVDSMIGVADQVGFNLVVSWWDAYLTMGADAELRLTYTVTDPSVNTDPVVAIHSPEAGAVYYENTPILLSATASDQEDGDISPSIKWTWPYYPLPDEPSYTTEVFYAGTHTITASVTDSAGTTASQQVTFTVLANTPPSVTILSPANGSQVTEGDVISLQATADDPEEGDLSAVLAWSSSVDGPLGSGSPLSSNTLSPGTHTITAAVTDGGGLTGEASVTATVYPLNNMAPQVSIQSPADNTVITQNEPLSLSGSASDLEEGDLSGSIQWSSSIDGVLGTGASFPTFYVSVGTHVIKATVTDSWGETGTASVNVTVNTAAPVYCDARGNNANYEWIESVTFGGVTKQSGSNGGYADLTAEPAIELVTGDNSITLTPGFRSSSYNEYWSIWIDFDNNSDFSVDELFYSGSSSGTISAVAAIPAGVSGTARMRVAMKYGGQPSSCGTFTYGEVEDYTVNITAGAEPPEEPPPGPVSYCTSSGNSSSYEWIKSVKLNDYTYTSNNNSGYADHTGGAPLNASRSQNTITLTPGFNYSSYQEHWSVWVDLDHDGVLAPAELLYNGVSSSALSGSLVIPGTALSGSTRMRVSMKYGGAPPACGAFAFGEVEDFTLAIP